MSLLTEQEIREVHEKHSNEFLFEDTINFARAIEAAVIAKIKAQGPVAKVDANDDGYWADILPDNSVKVGQLLYKLPNEGD